MLFIFKGLLGRSCWARGGGGQNESLGAQEHGQQPSRSPLALFLGLCAAAVTPPIVIQIEYTGLDHMLLEDEGEEEADWAWQGVTKIAIRWLELSLDLIRKLQGKSAAADHHLPMSVLTKPSSQGPLLRVFVMILPATLLGSVFMLEMIKFQQHESSLGEGIRGGLCNSTCKVPLAVFLPKQELHSVMSQFALAMYNERLSFQEVHSIQFGKLKHLHLIKDHAGNTGWQTANMFTAATRVHQLPLSVVYHHNQNLLLVQDA
eukprot:1161400-Pelagomonas_calceolata.AAC.3